MQTRRSLLTAGATGLATALAGCSSNTDKPETRITCTASVAYSTENDVFTDAEVIESKCWAASVKVTWDQPLARLRVETKYQDINDPEPFGEDWSTTTATKTLEDTDKREIAVIVPTGRFKSRPAKFDLYGINSEGREIGVMHGTVTWERHRETVTTTNESK